ncbi:lysophospholipid acyltransferase family protein [Luteithermobacter gelatinilyticus]|uniref:lysophospholipid acyltransferase family protein n=1 Tax=Luteithermobacter gelatinilyticus TaxID=2582913 RepID=UPI00110721FC|nr:lysophospholipid acyltransferase family protein [Luteithermobacter gelatinilyticus]
MPLFSEINGLERRHREYEYGKKRMMARLRSLVFTAVFYVWGGVYCTFCLPALLMHRRFLVRAQTFWSHSILFLSRTVAGIHFEVRGAEHIPRTPCIIAMKHQSAFDTLIMHALLKDPAFVMKRELLKIPLYGQYCKKSEMIPIDRSAGPRSMRTMMRAARKMIDAGRSVVIFPEGTRTLPGQRHAYRSGIYGLYKHTQKPVVPVAVNSGLFWPKKGFRWSPGTIIFEFLPPIEPGLEKKEFLAVLEERIEDASLKLLEAV